MVCIFNVSYYNTKLLHITGLLFAEDDGGGSTFQVKISQCSVSFPRRQRTWVQPPSYLEELQSLALRLQVRCQGCVQALLLYRKARYARPKLGHKLVSDFVTWQRRHFLGKDRICKQSACVVCIAQH